MTAVWQAEGDALRLHLDTDPTGGRVLPLDPPMYLDEARGAVGPLSDLDLDHRLLNALLGAPPLPAADAGRVSAELVGRFPGLPLPLPEALREVHVDEPLVPVLRLHALPETASAAAGSGLRQALSLAFAYGEHRVSPPPDATSRLLRDDTIFEIARDADGERAALARLVDCGFCPWTVDGEPVFVAAADDRMQAVQHWQAFLEVEIPQLEKAGWQIEYAASFHMDFTSLGDIEARVDDQGGWFDLQLGVEVDGQRLDLVPLLGELIARIDSPEALPEDEDLLVELGDGRWLSMPARRIRPLVATLFELFGGEVPARDTIRLNRMEAAQLDGLDELVGRWQGGAALRELGRRLRDLSGIAEVAPPEGLQAELRGYQRRGLDWLQFLGQTGFGGILADDMGLGKTLQTLAYLLLEKEAGRLDQPALIVAPTSLMANWRHEAARFTPALSVLTLHGAQRHARFAEIPDHDLVLTTYPLLARDQERLLGQRFHTLVLDEAQTIKNPRAKAAQVARRLAAGHRLCLTGTPMENHLGELWSLFHFLAPGYLGDEKQFRRLFRVPIETHDDPLRRDSLKRRIAPFMLRRTKLEVAAELPEKTVIVRSVALQDAQADLYEGVRAAMDRKVRDSLSSKGLARSQITILDALLKLRQICCDPRLLRLQQARKTVHSAKLELLMQMLPELLEEGRRILLFSQFTSMLRLIEERLDALGIAYSKLTGQTRKREQAIARFRRREVPLFLISLKAGGVGLNLTEADTVIHYDPWWNPAVEEQATDRAHRIGQSNKVFVYKLVTDNTVEEKILALQARKAALADGLYREGGAGGAPQFDEQDLRELLRPIE